MRDVKKVFVASRTAFPIAGVLMAVVAADRCGIAYYFGTHHEKQSVALAAKIDTVRITQQARAVAAETVTVKLKAKARVRYARADRDGYAARCSRITSESPGDGDGPARDRAAHSRR
jgi:transketolase C-terminal domain/subunit